MDFSKLFEVEKINKDNEEVMSFFNLLLQLFSEIEGNKDVLVVRKFIEHLKNDGCVYSVEVSDEFSNFIKLDNNFDDNICFNNILYFLDSSFDKYKSMLINFKKAEIHQKSLNVEKELKYLNNRIHLFELKNNLINKNKD